MKPQFGREIALLTLPILIIGGVAMWNGKIKSWSGFGAPLGLFEGKPRLEITSWKPETPSALDFARGISSRWTVTTWGGGACPGSGERYSSGGVASPTTFYFAWKRAGKWHRTPFREGTSQLDVRFFELRRQPTNRETQLGLPLDLVPRDAEEVRLRGYLMGYIGCQGKGILAPSAPVNLVLKAPGQPWPQFQGNKTGGSKRLTIGQSWCLPDPKIDPKGDLLQVVVIYHEPDQTQSWSLKEKSSRVLDSQGKRVADAEWVGSSANASGSRVIKWRVDTRQLKGHQGPFTFKSWVYADENEWPLQVSIPLNISKASKTVG